MTSTAFFVLLGMLVAGGVLVVTGRRGWRINDHPICRQCEFDLIGAYPGIVTCPECGAGLKREGWVRIGARRRPGALVVAGCLLMLLPMAPLGVYVYAGATGTNLNKYKPLGLLLWESAHAPPATCQAIAEELQDRMVAGRLSKDQTATVVNAALALQADPKRPWHEAWGSLLSQAMLSGDLPREKQKEFRDNAAVLTLECRGAVRAGDALPLLVKSKEARVSPDATYLTMVGLKAVTLGGETLPTTEPVPSPVESESGWFSFLGSTSRRVAAGLPSQFLYLVGSKSRMMGWGQTESEIAWVLKVPPTAKPGRTTVEVELRITMSDFGMGNSRQPTDPLRAKKGKYRAVTLQVPVEVLPSEAPGVQMVEPTAELEKQIRGLLQPESAMIYDSSRQANLSFRVSKMPVPICFDVFSKDSTGKERRIGVLTSGRGHADAGAYGMMMSQGNGQRHLYGNVGKLKGGKTDLIFRPSAAAALRTVDLTRIYNGEIVLRGVEIQTQQAMISTRASSMPEKVEEEADEESGDDPPQSPLPAP